MMPPGYFSARYWMGGGYFRVGYAVVRGLFFPPRFYTPQYFQPSMSEVTPAGFVITDAASGALIAFASDSARTFDLSGLIPDGAKRLSIVRQDKFGNRSSAQIIDSETVSDTPAAELAKATSITTVALAGGMIAVDWTYNDDGRQAVPAEWEIAALADLGTILKTVTGSTVSPQARRFRAELGPYTDDNTVRLAVRASDGVVSGLRGVWIVAPPVVAQADTPAAPEFIT